MFLLDTNTCIRILGNTSPQVLLRLRQHAPSVIFLSAVVRAELNYGARRSRRVDENLALLERFAGPMMSLPFDDLCAEHYGDIRSDLARQGLPIGPNDLMIAATARAHGLILVTNNVREFRRVAGLEIEDWEAE